MLAGAQVLSSAATVSRPTMQSISGFPGRIAPCNCADPANCESQLQHPCTKDTKEEPCVDAKCPDLHRCMSCNSHARDNFWFGIGHFGVNDGSIPKSAAKAGQRYRSCRHRNKQLLMAKQRAKHAAKDKKNAIASAKLLISLRLLRCQVRGWQLSTL